MIPTRRRFLSFASAAALVAPAAQAYRWQGAALGARAQIVLDHPRASRITARALAEIDRLEDIFSLYRPGTELVRLNEAGRFAAPAFELLECLATARIAHRITRGRFDPTVQRLWQVEAEAAAAGHLPAEDALAAARATVGFEGVRFDSAGIALSPGQRLTLNGIAQGYIADRVARLMRDEGVEDVLIDTGEIVAVGAPEGQAGWPITIADGGGKRLLSGRALATSALFGTVFDAAGHEGHILDPRGERPERARVLQVSVSAGSAALADALSTGLCLVSGRAEAVQLLHGLKDVCLEDLRTEPTIL